jgi:hypothetical protein
VRSIARIRNNGAETVNWGIIIWSMNYNIDIAALSTGLV